MRTLRLVLPCKSHFGSFKLLTNLTSLEFAAASRFLARHTEIPTAFFAAAATFRLLKNLRISVVTPCEDLKAFSKVAFGDSATSPGLLTALEMLHLGNVVDRDEIVEYLPHLSRGIAATCKRLTNLALPASDLSVLDSDVSSDISKPLFEALVALDHLQILSITLLRAHQLDWSCFRGHPALRRIVTGETSKHALLEHLELRSLAFTEIHFPRGTPFILRGAGPSVSREMSIEERIDGLMGLSGLYQRNGAPESVIGIFAHEVIEFALLWTAPTRTELLHHSLVLSSLRRPHSQEMLNESRLISSAALHPSAPAALPVAIRLVLSPFSGRTDEIPAHYREMFSEVLRTLAMHSVDTYENSVARTAIKLLLDSLPADFFSEIDLFSTYCCVGWATSASELLDRCRRRSDSAAALSALFFPDILPKVFQRDLVLQYGPVGALLTRLTSAERGEVVRA